MMDLMVMLNFVPFCPSIRMKYELLDDFKGGSNRIWVRAFKDLDLIILNFEGSGNSSTAANNWNWPISRYDE